MSDASQVKQKLIEYFQSGEKVQNLPFQIGMELEHFIVFADTKKAVPYHGEYGIQHILEELREWYPKTVYEGEFLVGLCGRECILTLEPAAQIEISIEPKESLPEIERVYGEFRERLDEIVKKYGYMVLTCGYHPVEKVDDLPLIPKKRYQYMDDYFLKIGHYGREMMRGTASTQVSIDYSDEKDFQKKYKMASILAPFFMYAFSNSPTYEGKKNTYGMLRKRIWDQVDPMRVRNIVETEFDNLTYEKYAEFVMHAPLIVRKELQGVSYTEQLSGNCYSGQEQWELDHMLSMVFPMIRLKQFIEIRYVDALEISHAMCYAAWIKGLFQDIHSLEQCINDLEAKNCKDVENAIQSLLKDGDEACIYGTSYEELFFELYEIAWEHLKEEEKKYLTEEYLPEGMKQMLLNKGMEEKIER